MSLMGMGQFSNAQANYCHQCRSFTCFHMMQGQQQMMSQEALQLMYGLQQRGLANGLSMADINSITTPSEPTKPTKPNKKLLLLTE